jgi:hypothetical protein
MQMTNLFMIIDGEPGRQYRLQASTDLVLWNDLTNLLNTTGTWQFVDGILTGQLQRFYRVISP